MRAHQSPWVSSEFLSLIDAREYTARSFRKSPTPENALALKLAKSAIQKLKHSLKKSYIEQCLSKHPNDPKKLWRTTRTFWPNNKGNNSTNSSINNLTDSHQMADFMNEFFCNTGKCIQSQISSDATLEEFKFFHNPPIFEFKDISLEDINDAINRLSSNPSSGIDHISAYMIKTANWPFNCPETLI